MSLPRYGTYDQSELEWLDELPAHWRLVKIKHLLSDERDSIKIGPFGSQLTSEMLEAEGWKVYGQENVIARDFERGSRFVSTEKFEELESCAVQPGDVLITMMGSSGRCALVPRDAAPGLMDSHLLRLRIGREMDPRFFLRAFGEADYVAHQVSTLGKGSIMHGLNSGIVKQIALAVPPLAEQSAIVGFLERETTKIDALIAEQDRLIALLAEKRQAAVSHAVTRGLAPAASLKDADAPWLGLVPEHWKLSQLKHVAKPGTSITYGIVQAGPHIEGGVPYIKTSDMAGESLSLDGMSRTSLEIDASYARSKVASGDIVIAIRATVGKCLPVPPELAGANLTQGTAKVTPGPDVMPEFLLNYLRATPAQTYFDAMAKGATFKEITLDALRRTPIPVPPLDEQRSIVHELQERARVFDQLAIDAEAAIALLRERRSALITAAVTGQIDVCGIARRQPALPEGIAA